MKRPALRVTIQIAAVAILVAVALLVIGPVRGELERRITALKVEAIDRIENILGRDISYSSISPSILRYLAINDLTVHGISDEPADLVTIQRLKIYYRPIELIRRNYSAAFSEIRIENTSLSVDTRRDADLVAIWSDIAGAREAAGATSLIPENLTLSGRNIELKIASEIGIFRVDNLFFASTAEDDVVSLRGEGDVLFLLTSVDSPVSEIEGKLEASGTVDLTAKTALFDVNVPTLSSDIASVDRQVFQVSYSNDVLEARKVRDRNPVDFYVRMATDPVEVYARILSDGYRLSDLVRLNGEYAGLNQYLQTPVRGQASATITESGVTYAGSVLTTVSDLPVPDGDLTVQFSGDNNHVRFDRFELRTSEGDVEFEGNVQLDPFRPDGRFGLRNVVYGGIDPISVTGTVRAIGDTVVVDTNRFTYAGVRFEDLSGMVALGSTYAAEMGVTLQGDRRLDMTADLAAGSLLVAPPALRRFSVDAHSVLPSDLERVQKALLPSLEMPDLSFLPEHLIVDARMSGDMDNGLRLTVPLFRAVDGDNPDNTVSFAMTYSDERIEVQDATVAYGGYHGSGDFSADLGGGSLLEFDSSVVVEGIPYQFSGSYDQDGSLQISGLHDVNARFTFNDPSGVSVQASGNIPVPIAPGVESRLAFSGEGYYASEDDWSVEFNDLEAIGVPYYAVKDSRIQMAGTFGPAGGSLRDIRYEDEYSELFGTGSVQWQLPQIAGAVDLVLTDALGDETYGGSIRFDGTSLDLSATFTELPLLRAGISTVRGSLTGSVDVEGPLDALRTTVAARLIDGRFNGDLVEVDGAVTVSPDSIELTGASGRYVRTRFEDVAARLTLADGLAKVSGSVIQPGETGDVTVGVDMIGEFGEGHDGFGELLSADLVARAVVTGIPVRNDLPSDWQFSVDRTDGTFTVRGGPQDALVGEIAPDGSFTVSMKSPVPLHFDAVGSLRQGRIEADLTNVQADVASLWHIVASPGVTFQSGTAEGAIRIVGPLNDPDYYGTLVASNITGTVDIVADLVGPAKTFLVFDEKVLNIRETVAPVGPGRIRMSAAMTLDRWLPDEYRIWVSTVDDDSIRVINDFGGVAVDGRARGDLVVTGGADQVRIAGNLIGENMFITLSDIEETVEDQTDTGDMIVDVNVTTGRGVQFLWPSDSFPILRGFAGAGETARITHQKSTGTYTVTGTVDIQGGEVFYFDRSFYIKEGRMVFDEDQSNFDPLLSVNAEIREVGPNGPMRIYLVADEKALSQFTPQWRSDPPMPEADIIALLGGNVFVTESGDPINLSQAMLLTSDLVSQFGIIRGFENTVRETLGLDLFSIRTQLFQNLIRGVMTQAVDYPLDTQVPSLGQYLDNTTLFVGKYLGTDLFLELLVQLRATDPLEGPTRTLAGITVDSELSLEWQTPFFLLDWSFFPRDPSTLFLTDNTISFGWEYSY